MLKFSQKLELKNAFFHIKLSENSRELTTFMTETGMYRFKRLVFGVKCAPEIFQRAMERILPGLSGVIVFIDDILVYADSLEALRKQTKAVLAALQANNLTLNPEKCEYEKKRIKFLGHELSGKGMESRNDREIQRAKIGFGTAKFPWPRYVCQPFHPALQQYYGIFITSC